MDMSVRLPKLEPNAIQPPACCPPKYPKTRRRCTGTRFKMDQVHCRNPVRDLRTTQVIAKLYRCLKCQRILRLRSGQALPRLSRGHLVRPTSGESQSSVAAALHARYQLPRRGRPLGKSSTIGLQNRRSTKTCKLPGRKLDSSVEHGANNTPARPKFWTLT
jgi:hypothetical protein